MNELNLLSTERPGLVAIDNFEQLKATLQGLMARYEGRVYGPEMLALAKNDKKELTRLRKQIDERRKEVKRTYLEPYNAFEAQVKKLLALIDAPLDEIKAVVAEADERERAAKREEVYAFFRTKAGMLGSFADQVWNSPAFAESKWFTKTCSASVWQREDGHDPHHRRTVHRRADGAVSQLLRYRRIERVPPQTVRNGVRRGSGDRAGAKER